MSQEFDWSRFSLKIYIDAPLQAVYDAWTIRRNLENWFLRMAEFKTPSGKLRGEKESLKLNDAYVWMWYGYPDSVAEHGTVTAANGTNLFSFIFGKAGVVSVQLTPHGDTTEILLTQDQIPTDEKGRSSYHVRCSNGWTFYLANLKSMLEGGIDLRNKNPNFTNVINS